MASPPRLSDRIHAALMVAAAGSANTCLGLMDLLFDLRRGTFREATADAQIEKAIVAASLAFGPLTMARLWRRRSRLLG